MKNSLKTAPEERLLVFEGNFVIIFLKTNPEMQNTFFGDHRLPIC